MGFTVDRATLADGLKFAAKVKTNGILEALNGIVLDASGDSVTLSRTDLETWADVTVPARVDSSIRILAADLKMLSAYVSKDGSDRLTFEVGEDGRVSVSGDGPVSAALKAGKLEDFPARPDYAPVGLAPVDVDVVSTVCKAASTDEARVVLMGVRFDDGECAATDSYRLARGTFGPAGHPLDGVLIPSDVVGRLVGQLEDVTAGSAGDGWGAVFVGALVNGPKKARRVCKVRLAVRGIEGRFPNYRQLWPESTEATVSGLDVGEWDAALRQMTAVVKAGNSPVVIEANGSVKLSMGHREAGDLSAAVSGRLEGAWPDGMTVALNPQYMRDSLAMAGEGCRVELRDALKPVLFVGGAGVSVLQMPMRY